MKRTLLTAVTLLVTLGAVAQPGQVQTRGVQVVPDRPHNQLSVSVWTDRSSYDVGDNIRVSYRANSDAYVLIFSTDSRGQTRQILPNRYDNDNFVRAGRTYTIPTRGYQLEVTPPSGRETISIVAFRERNQALSRFNSFGNDAFPRSEGARSAIARVIVRPDDGDRGRRYAEDSTSFQVVDRGWNHRPSHPPVTSPGRPGGPRPPAGRDQGRLTINSNPGGAYVHINGQYSGITPLDFDNVRPGTYNITISRAGFQPAQQRVTVKRNDRTRVSKNLQPVRYW